MRFAPVWAVADAALREWPLRPIVLINKIQTIDEIQSTETLISLQNPILRDVKP